MNRIIEYKLVNSNDLNSLNRIVNELIKEGYQPFERSYYKRNNYEYNQAMVKYAPDTGLRNGPR